MTLNYVSLICDLYDGGGNVITQGVASFAPTVIVTDATDHEIVTQVPVTAAFKVTGPPAISLLATDNANLNPVGWGWTVTLPAVTGVAAFTFFLPYASGSVQYMSQLAPTSSAVTMLAYLPLSGGQMTGALAPAEDTLADGSTIAVNATLGNVFAVTLGGNRTLGSPSGGEDGQKITVRVIQPASGGPYTLSYGAAYDFGATGSPTLSTAAHKVDILGFEYVASLSKWCCLGAALGF